MAKLELGLKMEVDGEEAYKLIEVASKIIKSHEEDLTKEEKEEYQKAVDHFSENGVQFKA